MNEKRISLPRKIDGNRVAELRLTQSGQKLVTHSSSRSVKSLAGLPSEFNGNALYSLKRYTASDEVPRPCNARIEENDPLRKRRREIADMISKSDILSDLAKSKPTSKLLQGLPKAPAFSLEAGTDSAILVAPSRAGKSTLTNALARETTLPPADFQSAYADLFSGAHAGAPRELPPQITLVATGKVGLGAHHGDEDGEGRRSMKGVEEEEDGASSSGSEESVVGNGGVGGSASSALSFRPTRLKNIDEWVTAVESDPDYMETLQGIKDAFQDNECVPFRGPLLAVEENRASTLVPTAVTASAEHERFQFVLEIPFISDSDIRSAISLLEGYTREVHEDDEQDPEALARDAVEDARARDLFGLSAMEEERVVAEVVRLRREGWKLPGHWQFVIGHKLVWRFQPKSFQEGSVAVHDFALKVLHGPWSFWPLVSFSGVQMSIPGNIPALVDLPGIALDGSVRDLLLPRYLRDFSANTYVFVVEWTGQMDGDVRQLARNEDFVRQALVLGRAHRECRGEIEEVPPVLMFVAVFDRASCVKMHFTKERIEEMIKRESYMETFKERLRVNLRDILTCQDSDDDTSDDGSTMMTLVEMDALIRGAEESGAIQYQMVCTLRSNAKQDEMVARLKDNVKRAYGLQNDVWMSWLRKCGSLILERQDFQEQLRNHTSDMQKKLTRVLRQFLGNAASTDRVVGAVMAHLGPLRDHLNACLDDALLRSTPRNFETWRAQQMLVDNNPSLLTGGLRCMGEGNKLITWLMTAVHQRLAYRFYNGQLAEYHRLPWVRQLARDITQVILPERVTGDTSGFAHNGSAGAGGPSGGSAAAGAAARDSNSRPQSSSVSSVASTWVAAGAPGGDDDGGVVAMQWNRVYSSVLQVLIDGIHAALAAITPHDLRTFGRQVALLRVYFPRLAQEALSRYKGKYSTRQRYTYLCNRAPDLIGDVADNMRDAFGDYLAIWAAKAAADIRASITNLSNEILGSPGQSSDPWDAKLKKFQLDLRQLDLAMSVPTAAVPQTNVTAPAAAPSQPRPQAAAPGPAGGRHIDAEDLDALRRMTRDQWVSYPIEVCRQVLVDLRVFTQEHMKDKCMQRRLLFKHLTDFLSREGGPGGNPDRRVRPRVG